MHRQIIAHMRRLIKSRRVRLTATLIVAAFLVINGIVLMLYHDRTYPKTLVGSQQLGSVKRSDLPQHLKNMQLLPSEITFHQDKTTAKVKTDALGVSPDYGQLSKAVMQTRSWLPITNLIQARQTPISLTYNQSALQKVITTTLAVFERAPTDARITRQETNFVIKSEVTGQATNISDAISRLMHTLEQGKTTVAVPTKKVSPAITSASLRKQLEALNEQIKTTISLAYNGQVRPLGAAEITNLYVEDKSVMTLSDSAILTTVNAIGASYGIVVENQAAAVTAIKAALQEHKSISFTLTAAPKAAKTIRYCTAVRGVSETELAGLNATLQSVFADSRGWGLTGLVRFERAAANCDFYVWLTAANQMSSFGAICDPDWSCAVSPNVVINYTRWQETSPAWAASGGSREDYRAMVINHETGHWFGFHHSSCPGAGQPAPVMQQQSIDLQGCVFNPWPTAGEQAALKQRLGL